MDELENILGEPTVAKTPTSESNTFKFDEPGQAATAIEQAQLATEDKVTMPDGYATDFCITIIDGILLQLGGGAWYKKKLKAKMFESEADYIKAKEAKYKLNPSDDDKKLAGDFTQFLEKYSIVEKQLPLSEQEKDILRPPLEAMTKKFGGDLPPGIALVVVAAQIIIPRLNLE